MSVFFALCLVAIAVWLLCKIAQLTFDMWRLWRDDQAGAEDPASLTIGEGS